MLYQNMLEAASGSQERPAFFSAIADCVQGAFHASVRASGSAKYAMIFLQLD
jgi:hypothetical protein